MNITCAFTNYGQPAIGLSPVISGWTTAGALVVSGDAMTEVASGFYTYAFNGYDYLEDYCFVAYASTLNSGEQYVFMSNDNDSQNSQGIIKQILGLCLGNSRVTNQVYDGSGNLLTANIYSYDNAADCTLDQNRLHTYAISCSYTDGKLSSYKSVEV